MVQVVGERGRRRDVGDHAGLRGQRARHQPHLQLGAGQLLALPLHLDAGALNVEAGHGAGARGLLGEGQVAAHDVEGLARHVDQRQIGGELIVELRDLALGLARDRLLAMTRRFGETIGRRDARPTSPGRPAARPASRPRRAD